MKAERESQWDEIEKLKNLLAAEKERQEAVVQVHGNEQDDGNNLEASMNKKMDAIMNVIQDLSGRLDQQVKESTVVAKTEVHRWRFVDGIPDKMRQSI